MLKGYRDGKFAIGLVLGVALATLCFLWVFSVNYCPNAPCNYQKPPDNSETYGQRWFPIPWNPNSTLQPQPEFAEGAPKHYEYNDLKAQENMARATNVIAWATVVTVFTSIIGVWLLVRNLFVTRESSRDETRAYVHIKGIEVEADFDPYEGEWFADCVFQVENSGATPCKRFEIEGGAICSIDEQICCTLPVRNDEPKGWSGLPGKEVFTAEVKFQLNGCEALDTDECFMHVGGVVRYTTFFDERFETEFSFMLKRRSHWDEATSEDNRRQMFRTSLATRTYEQTG